MASLKARLKLARDALGKKDYATARDAALKALDEDPDNYNANVFIGLAYLELGDHEQSERAYRKAIEVQPDQLLAWQGLLRFYERVGNSDKIVETLRRLVDIHAKANDATKCAEAVQKLIELRRKEGTRRELLATLALQLPGSPVYSLLCTLPPPDLTNPTASTILAVQQAIHNSLPLIEEYTSLIELDEEETLNSEFQRRKTRIDAPPVAVLKNQIGVEIWKDSRLPEMYNEILNHPNTNDELRRETDRKLLRYKRKYWLALPESEAKKKVGAELEKLVEGAVVLNIPDELAWSMFLEAKDSEDVVGYGLPLLEQYMDVFPTSKLTTLLRSYFAYVGIDFHDGQKKEEDVKEIASDDEDDKDLELVRNDEPEDLMDTILDAYSTLTDSLIATRALIDVYYAENDYQNTINLAESALSLLSQREVESGRNLSLVRIGLKASLSIALVHLFPPKHHARALSLIDEVLAQSPNNTTCLLGRAYIAQTSKKWVEAAVLFERVDNLLPEDFDLGLRAREEGAWCRSHTDEVESSIATLQGVLDVLKDLDERKSDIARCLYRIGMGCWRLGVSRREEAYTYFIGALKQSSTYAPPYTALGIYYTEFVSPPDHARGSKCFQKAFELDPREADAARRLALGFADEREWDLVEVIARRTIEGEGGLAAAGGDKQDAAAEARYLPVNAWAWKALGVAEFSRRKYASAIQALQVALRAEPDDGPSWLRLGEAYGKAGRYAAALKALGRAKDLQPDHWLGSYLLGEVYQRMGQYLDAIQAFESILVERPTELAALLSLAQSQLDQGQAELYGGYRSRAETSFISAIETALLTMSSHSEFRGMMWKIIADALFLLAKRSRGFHEITRLRQAASRVASLLPTETIENLSDILPARRHTIFGASAEIAGTLPSPDASAILELAIAVYDFRISFVGSSEGVIRGSAWFDLGVAVHALSSSPSSLDDVEKQRKIKEKAIEFMIRALREDVGNASYWVGLGDAHFTTQVKSAQHAYIKALEVDSKNVVAWTNLGLLYLYHDDLELANEALYRAQTLDPDHSLAWVGQALVARANGHETDTNVLLEHAISLTVPIPLADLEYASGVVARPKKGSATEVLSIDALLPAFFALGRYKEQQSHEWKYNASAFHLFGLVCERLGHLEYALELIEESIALLESAYEDTEDPEVERHFTIAHVNAARVKLSLKDFEGAVESFQTALGLLGDDEGGEQEDTGDTGSETGGGVAVLRAQAQAGCGLAMFLRGDLEPAMGYLQSALVSAGEDDLRLRGQIVVLLAQTMWAIGTEEFMEGAKGHLLECISSDPENLAAINVLAGMGILTDDDNLVDAALSEILALPQERRTELDPQGDVLHLLVQHHLGQGNLEKAKTITQKAIFAEPTKEEIRIQLAKLSLQQGDGKSALSILSSSPSSSTLFSSASGGSSLVSPTSPASLSLQAIAHAQLSKTASMVNNGGDDGDDGMVMTVLAKAKAQKAIMLAPSRPDLWKTLAYVRAYTQEETTMGK